MRSLLYVSTRSSGGGFQTGDIDDIVTKSRSRNGALGVTGALVVTSAHYAQILEGAEAALDELMASIGRDGRHGDIRLASLENKPRREFARWTLAYSGESTYVANLVETAIAASNFGDQRSFDDIRSLMLMLA